MNGITFTIQSGGLGRPIAGEDHICGLITYIANADIPAGFTTTDRIKTIYSLQDANDLGIVSTSAVDEVKVLEYQISELFKMNKKAVVYVGIYDNTAPTYDEIDSVRLFADGKIRQFGVVDVFNSFHTGIVMDLQQNLDQFLLENQPAVAILGMDTSATPLADLADLRSLACPLVSVMIGQDGTQKGNNLFVDLEISIPNVGAALGALSLAKVHENIGWIEKFNYSNGIENDVPAFGNGALVKLQSESLRTAINAKGWLFFTKETGVAGTFMNDSHTATPLTGDFAYLENNRTIQKAVRNVRTLMVPAISAPLYLNADGTLQESTISYFKNNADRALEQMKVSGEISQYETTISPTQNVAATSELNIGISIVPVAVARQININIGFVTEL